MARFGRQEGEGKGGSGGMSQVMPLIVEPRCHICQSEYRHQVDKLLVSGMSHAEIAGYFEKVGSTWSRAAVGRHAKNHLTLHRAAVRRIVEERAREAVENVDSHKGFLATKRAALEVALQKGFENVANGTAKVELQDLVVVIDKLTAMEAEEHAHAIDEMVRDFNAFAAAVRMFVSEEKWPELVAMYKQNLDADKVPVLERMSGPGPEDPDDVTDVEVVDDE